MEHIQRAVAEMRSRQDRTAVETYRVPLRGSMVLDVVDVPLNVLILNSDSFRIAPQLADHPKRDIVRRDPESAEGQAVVAELVRGTHRHANELKENLVDEGQTQPGVITRDGKLINANTRCVLLRELVAEGRSVPNTLRVAVLPSDVTNQELLELEMVLQQQVELKDEYRLINKLMMVQRLHEEGFTDEQIARKLRKDGKSGTRNGAQKIKEQRQVLHLMERARHLLTDPIPITDFDSDIDQAQNWSELLRETAKIEGSQGYEAADQHIRRWLIAYFSGISSVHQLRSAVGDWVEADGVVEEIKDNRDLQSILDFPAPEALDPKGGGNGADAFPSQTPPTPSGLELLGTPSPRPAENTRSVAVILDVVAAAHKAGDGPVVLPDGTSVPGNEVKERVNKSVKSALDRVRRRRDAGGRLVRPISELERARLALGSAIDALQEVVSDPSFRQHDKAQQLTEEIASLTDEVVKILESHVPADGDEYADVFDSPEVIV